MSIIKQKDGYVEVKKSGEEFIKPEPPISVLKKVAEVGEWLKSVKDPEVLDEIIQSIKERFSPNGNGYKSSDDIFNENYIESELRDIARYHESTEVILNRARCNTQEKNLTPDRRLLSACLTILQDRYAKLSDRIVEINEFVSDSKPAVTKE